MQSPVEFSVLGASPDHGRGQFYLSGESQSPKLPFFRPMRIRCPRRRRASRRATPPFLSSPKRRGEPCVRPRTRTIPPRVGRIGAITRIAPTMSDHLHACRGEPAAAGVRPAQVPIHAPAPGRPLGPTLQRLRVGPGNRKSLLLCLPRCEAVELHFHFLLETVVVLLQDGDDLGFGECRRNRLPLAHQFAE